MADTNYKIGLQITADGARAESELKKIDAMINRLGANVSGAASSFAGNVAANAVSKLTALAIDGGAAIVDYSAKLEQTEIGFETLLGGAEAAERHLRDLQSFAKSTPFEFEGLTKLSQRLVGVGVTSEKIVPLLRDIGNAVAAVGGTADQVDGVTIALSQMISKGKVSAEEMEQLAERQVNGWAMLADFLGKTQGEVRQLAADGKISTDVFLKAFQQFSQMNFGDAMERQSHTFSGALSNIKDATLIAAATSFEPLYEEISRFTDKVASRLDADKSTLMGIADEFGFALGESIGLGAARYFNSHTFDQIMSDAGFWGKAVIDPRNSVGWKLGESIARGISAGVRQAGEFTDLAEINGTVYKINQLTNTLERLNYNKTGTFGGTTYQLDRASSTIKAVSDSVKAMPAIAPKLDTKKAEKQLAEYKSILDGLNTSVVFFGDETETAATKQKFLNAGIYDFNDAQAQAALKMAGALDNLKKARKEQEDYNGQLKSAADYMQDLRDNARFEASFPDATGLQKFDFWAKQNAEQFKELKFEIEATRRAIEAQAWAENWKDFVSRGKAAFDALDSEISSFKTKLSDEDNFLIDFAVRFQIKGDDNKSLDENARNFAYQVKFYEDKLAELKARQKKFAPESNDALVIGAELDGYTQAYQRFLLSLQSQVGGDLQRVFGDKIQTMDQFQAKVRELRAVISDKQLEKGLETLDDALASLGITIGGFGAKSELDTFNDFLADPVVTRAIEARAAAIGYTAEQLKELLRQKKAAQDAGGTRPRIVGETEAESGGFLSGLGISDGMIGGRSIKKITSEAEAVKAVYADLGATVGDVFGQMAQAAQVTLENFILTGTLGGEAFKQLAASVIASVGIQAGVKALFEIAEGYAAAANPFTAYQAPFHFAAAKMYGLVSAAAIGTGVAIGAAGGLGGQKNTGQAGRDQNRQGGITGRGGGGGGGIDRPDYYTANPNISTTNPQTALLGSEVNKLAEAVAAMHSKISSMKPGDVLTRGVSEKKGFIADTVTTELKSNGTRATNMGRALRLG